MTSRKTTPLIYPRNLSIFIMSMVLSYSISAQSLPEQTTEPNVKTVQLFRSGWEMSEPVIMLASDEQLTLSFDEFGPDAKQYYYSIVHLDAQNNVSRLAPSEYLAGFPHTPIDDYSYSFNTTRNYTHYKATFPNDDLKILKSGNYAIIVYKDYEVDDPIFVRHFKVTEQKVSISPELRFPMKGQFRDTRQQINLRISHPELTIRNPQQEVKVIVTQNGRTDNLVDNIKPDFVRSGELVYEYQDVLLFEGGNEFRWLDIRSTRFIAEHIQKIFFADPYYQVLLKNDFIRWNLPYFRKDDTNGKYVVSVREYDNAETDADYLFVHFTLPLEAPLPDGDIYVMGELTDWRFDKTNKMHYNIETKSYELTLLLKQGFYNYLYAFMPRDGRKADLSITEGNHSVTDNDYHVFVYFRGPSDYYDRLIGYTTFNSKNGIK
ncbi:MAG: DUF5103 domain-containing protein [Breznakibacter sp.]